MQRSETVKEIAPAFLAAQMAMKAAPKDAENPHFKSAYSDFCTVVEAVKAPLNQQGISFLQPVRLTEAGVEIETVLMHKSGEFYSDTLTIPLVRKDAQSVGSAISYGKRYGLQSICGLPSDDDDGNAATGKGDDRGQQRRQEQPARQQQKPAPDPEAVKVARELKALLPKAKLPDGTSKRWLEAAGVSTFEEMGAERLQKCLAHTKKHMADNQPAEQNA